MGRRLLLMLFVFMYHNGQALLLKDIKYTQSGFDILFYGLNINCGYRNTDAHHFDYFGTSGPLRNNLPIYNTDHLPYNTPAFNDYYSKSVCLISDTSFIMANNIATPELLVVGTQLTCNNDSSICTIDTLYIEYSQIFNFYYIDHLFNKKAESVYSLLTLAKAGGGSVGFTEKNIANYLIKTKPDRIPPDTHDAVIHYYKLPLSDAAQKLFQDSEHSLMLLEQKGTPSESITNIDFCLKKFDTTLQLLDSFCYSYNLFGDTIPNYFTFDYQKINNNNYIIAKYALTAATDANIYVWKYDTNFNLLDSVRFFGKNELENYWTQEAGKHYFFYTHDSSTIIKITNSNNDTIRSVVLPTSNKLLVTTDSSFITLQFEPSVIPYYQFTPSLYQWDINGRLQKYFKLEDLPSFSGIWKSNFNEESKTLLYAIDSFNNICYGYDHIEYSGCGTGTTMTYGIFNLKDINCVSGNITNDINQNCNTDAQETPVKNILVELQLHGRKFFTLSDDNGKYRFTPYDTGHAKIIVHLENQNYFSNACQDTFNVVISDTLPNPQVDFFLHTPTCNHPTPKLNVYISTPFLRRCFDNLYTLTVFNESNDTAYYAFVDLELDAHLIPTDTTFQSAQDLGNHTYRFQLGEVAPLQTIRKQLKIKVDCDSTILGQTHCVKAIASPYISCIVADHTYFTAIAGCRNDSVVFTVQNIGTPTNISIPYRVIINDTVTYQGQLFFTVANSIAVLSYANPLGKTFRLETRQTPIYPNEDTILSVSMEGCGNTDFYTGYITMFPQDDDQPNVSIDCHQNVGSFDPNDKSASPVGYGADHLIENTTAVEYTIHFQNLGTYAASFVTVVDTLSPALDIRTLKVMGSSADYSLGITDSNIVTFSFFNHNLPAAAEDSLLSNGFIKFSIQPKATAAIGTAIHNNAYITFDYNTPIKTNTVQHEIGRDFIRVNLISLVKNSSYNDINTKIYPNPASQQFIFELNKEVPKNTVLHFYNLQGKEIYSLSDVLRLNTINASNWDKGVYLFELKNGNNIITSGKIILQ